MRLKIVCLSSTFFLPPIRYILHSRLTRLHSLLYIRKLHPFPSDNIRYFNSWPLVKSYGVMELGQHWLSVWQHMSSTAPFLTFIINEIPMDSPRKNPLEMFHYMCQVSWLKMQYLPGATELMRRIVGDFIHGAHFDIPMSPLNKWLSWVCRIQTTGFPFW